MNPISSRITGVRKIGNQLINDNNEKIPSVYAKEGITNFLSFFDENSHGKSIVLVAHNGHIFDGKHLIRALNRTCLTDDFKSILAGFSGVVISPTIKASTLIVHPKEETYHRFVLCLLEFI